MALDIFGKKRKQKLLEKEDFILKQTENEEREVVTKDIYKLLDSQNVSSSASLQDWDERQKTTGRMPTVSYKILETIYKKESWVRAGVDAIQRTATSNGFILAGKDGNPKGISSFEFKQVSKLLENPNPNDTFTDIISEIIVDLHIYGDAYIEIVRDKRTGTPIGIFNLYAPSIRVLVDKNGTVLGYIQSLDRGFSANKQKPVLFQPEEIVHFKLPNPGNSVYGLSPLESLSLPIETDLLAQDYNLHFFKNNATPRLHVDLGNCTLAQLKRTREIFNQQLRGTKNSHKTIVTEGGASINIIGTKPSDMEFLNQRRFSREEILSVLGVPPMKVGIFVDVNRASADSGDKTFKSDKIIPLQRMISKKINNCILPLFNIMTLELKFVEIDLTDAKEQSEIDKIDIESGILTINEVRIKRGLEPRKDSQEPVNQKDPKKENINEDIKNNFINKKFS